MSDLFGPGGRQALDQLRLDPPFQARTTSLLRLVDAFDFEIDTVTRRVVADLARHPGYRAVRAIPGAGPVLAVMAGGMTWSWRLCSTAPIWIARPRSGGRHWVMSVSRTRPDGIDDCWQLMGNGVELLLQRVAEPKVNQEPDAFGPART